MTNKILSMDQLRELSRFIIPIPDFEGKGTLNVRVQKPRLLAMAAQGEIPNHLLGIATQMVAGKKQVKAKKEDEGALIKEAAAMTELYCQACLVEPKYEEFKEIMTDEQSDVSFRWAMGMVENLDGFRKDKTDGPDNDNGKEVPAKAE